MGKKMDKDGDKDCSGMKKGGLVKKGTKKGGKKGC